MTKHTEKHISVQGSKSQTVCLHVLNNCSSMAALDRFKLRHNAVLFILCNWLKDHLNPSTRLFADLSSSSWNPVSDLFTSLRPDIALVFSTGQMYIWELTVCHETNLVKSRDYKRGKYDHLEADLKTAYNNYHLEVHTIEVTSLGLISDTSEFTSKTIQTVLPATVENSISKTVISNSYNVYKKRNLSTDNN